MPSTLIIFLTDTMEYTVQGYEVAFRYIPKSRISDLLFSALDAAIEQISSKFFYFKFNQNTYSILTSYIIYCEIKNHITHLHCYRDMDGIFLSIPHCKTTWKNFQTDCFLVIISIHSTWH